MSSLSILIPAYQEERTIAEVIERVLAVDTEKLGFTKEILICDDGSTDNTPTIVNAFAKKEPSVHLFVHDKNQGKGAAIRTVLDHATGDYCLIQDADLEYAMEDYPTMLKVINDGALVVYGSRFLSQKRPTGMSFKNYFANRVITWTANLLYRIRITDEATCFKLFPTETLRSLNLQCTKFDFCAEVTAKIAKKKIKIHEVPIQYNGRSVADGKKIGWIDGVETMWALFKYRILK